MNAESYWSKQILHDSNNPPPAEGTPEFEALRLKAWEEYYRRQAAAAAAASHTNPNSQPQIKPLTHAQVQPVTHSENNTSENNNDGYPESLARYVQRCKVSIAQKGGNLAKLTDWVDRHIEQVIANALRAGTLWKVDWDSFPIANPPTFLLEAQSQPQAQVATSSARSYASVLTGSTANRHYGNSVQIQHAAPNPIGPTSIYSISSNQTSFSFSSVAQGNQISGEKSYYRPSTSFEGKASKSPENKRPIENSSYYGPSTSISNNDSSSNITNNYGIIDFDTTSDFVSFSSHSSNKQKRNKVNKDHQSTVNTKKSKNDKHQSGFIASSKLLAARANRFSSSLSCIESQKSTQQVQVDFGKYMGLGVIGSDKEELDESDFEKMTVKGTCKTLAKEYLRLTAPPKAELVRPQNILELHLKNLKDQWQQKSIEYIILCSQLKAIRQDLTVQRINNSFTVDVYETHARAALEESDMNEYNQCQTQLRYLYDLMNQVNYDKYDQAIGLTNQNEFIAYKLLYYIFLTTNKNYDGGSSDLTKIMLSLSTKQQNDSDIFYACNVRIAVSDVNYHEFFRLCTKAPKMCRYLMDLMLPFIRFSGLQRICKAYRPHVSLDFVTKELGFQTEVDAGEKWLISCGCKIVPHDTLGIIVSTKDTVLHASTLSDMKHSLI